jgi:hypothetical protein
MIHVITDHSKIVPEEEAARLEKSLLGDSFFEELKLFVTLRFHQGWLRSKVGDGGSGKPDAAPLGSTLFRGMLKLGRYSNRGKIMPIEIDKFPSPSNPKIPTPPSSENRI